MPPPAQPPPAAPAAPPAPPAPATVASASRPGIHDRQFWKFDPRHEGQVSKVYDHSPGAPTCWTRLGAASPGDATLTPSRILSNRPYALVSSIMVISGGAPTRTGGPQNPAPLVTYSWVSPNRPIPDTTGCCNRIR